MNVETFITLRNLPELNTISNEIVNLINLFVGSKKINKYQSKMSNQILKNPKMQLLKDKIENKVNLVLNKLSELNLNNLLFEFIELLGKINENDYLIVQKTFYYKLQSDINFVKIYLEFFKIISKVYKQVFNFNSEYFYNIIERKFASDYKNIELNELSFLEDFNEENKRINHLLIIKTMIDINMFDVSLKEEINKNILEQNNYFTDIYYWFQKETLSKETKQIINNKIINNPLASRDKVLLDSLLDEKISVKEKTIIKPQNYKSTINKSTYKEDTLKLETINLLNEWLLMEYIDDIKNFIDNNCKDAISKNKFCQYVFIKYFESSTEVSNKILELVKNMVKKQILFKSNLSRGVLLVNSTWEDSSLDFNNPEKKMKELLICLKNMGITKFLESLLKEFKIDFVENI